MMTGLYLDGFLAAALMSLYTAKDLGWECLVILPSMISRSVSEASSVPMFPIALIYVIMLFISLDEGCSLSIS